MANFTAKDIQTLRERTGVGMMDCKNALVESDGDMDAAVEILRKKGIATAAKKAGRIASQGIVHSYIHMGGKIGVLVEINCETDFVANNADFREFANNVALQICSMKPQYVAISDVPADVVEHEKAIYREKALNDPKPKPAAIIEKMLDGQIAKFFKEICLLEQEYFRDDSKTINQLLVEITQTIGEKISIRRFTRYEMGEGLEKKVDNFVDEINASVASMQK
ncbi:MAG: translation elongation factor Ts [Christensenellaceae bacterium]|jgi:elongation factor Ts|nr:translation elongation factor Ts [Christensenellaceae bacterium]